MRLLLPRNFLCFCGSCSSAAVVVKFVSATASANFPKFNFLDLADADRAIIATGAITRRPTIRQDKSLDLTSIVTKASADPTSVSLRSLLTRRARRFPNSLRSESKCSASIDELRSCVLCFASRCYTRCGSPPHVNLMCTSTIFFFIFYFPRRYKNNSLTLLFL